MSDLGYDPTDPDEWGDAEPAPRRSESRRLASMVSVRFTPDEVDELRRRAARAGQSMSGYLRALALAPETITSGDTLPTKASAAQMVRLGTVQCGRCGERISTVMPHLCPLPDPAPSPHPTPSTGETK